MCQKCTQTALGQRCLMSLGQQCEVIVLDENDRVLVAHHAGHRSCKLGVDLAIGLPVGVAEHRFGEGQVADRPDRLVGAAVVIAVVFFAGQPNALEVVGRIVGRDSQPAFGVSALAVGVPRAVSHPDAPDRLHDRVQRESQAPHGRPGANLAVGAEAVHERLAVRNVYEEAAADPLADQLGEL